MEIEFLMMFKNPSNDFVQETSSPLSWLWVFLFGFLYFAVKGIWTHAVANFILVICTVGLCQFVYPFFTYGIIRRHHLNKGWSIVKEEETP